MEGYSIFTCIHVTYDYHKHTDTADFGLELNVDIYNNLYPINFMNDSTSDYIDSHITGNLTFIAKPTLTVDIDYPLHEFEYYYTYQFGDNSSVDRSREENVTHLYKHGGNYSYYVDAIAVSYYKESAYYKRHMGTLVILGKKAVCSCANCILVVCSGSTLKVLRNKYTYCTCT